MNQSPGTLLFYVNVLTTRLSSLTLEQLASHVHVAPNTFAKIRNGEALQEKTFKKLEFAATALLQETQQWRFWPEKWQQGAFKFHRWMDRFFSQDPIERDSHETWIFERQRTLEGLLKYEASMVLPPATDRSVNVACYAQQLAWVYTDLAQLYAASTPLGALERSRWFERAGHCYKLAEEILGEQGHKYLQARACFSRIGARLAELPLGTAGLSQPLRAWMRQQDLANTVEVLFEEEFDYHARYQALVYFSVMGEQLACNNAYYSLCNAHPGFKSWKYTPDPTMKSIWDNVDMEFFRNLSVSAATLPIACPAVAKVSSQPKSNISNQPQGVLRYEG
ncbi:hypothetical protein ACIGHN_27560 [Acidovorax sp. NPDC077693]|uniref:hypothetical protein n=1 Tax=unclassified Acidovorax TaxID=2684926 RepID=UPI0037C520E1